jgi:hypothetical protein
MPPEGRGRDVEVSGFAFIGAGFVFSGAKGSPEEAAALAEMRERLGDDMFDRWLRSRERERHPRLLTESERDVIHMATAPVLRDLEASGALVPDVRYEAHADEGRDSREGVHAWIKGDDTSGWDVWTPTEESSPAEQVWWLAHQVQEWEIEELWHEGRSTTWPECPEHPNSHPLEPGIDGDDIAVWRCPRTQQVICAIGALGS